MRQATSELQTSGSTSTIYKIVPGAVGTKPVWNISVNINVFVYLMVLHLGDNNLGKHSDFRGAGVQFLSNFATQIGPGASMWSRSGPKSEKGWILGTLLAPWGTLFE